MCITSYWSWLPGNGKVDLEGTKINYQDITLTFQDKKASK